MSKRVVMGSLLALALAAVSLTGCEKKPETAKPAAPAPAAK